MPSHHAERVDATMRRALSTAGGAAEVSIVYAVMEVAAQLERLAASGAVVAAAAEREAEGSAYPLRMVAGPPPGAEAKPPPASGWKEAMDTAYEQRAADLGGPPPGPVYEQRAGAAPGPYSIEELHAMAYTVASVAAQSDRSAADERLASLTDDVLATCYRVPRPEGEATPEAPHELVRLLEGLPSDKDLHHAISWGYAVRDLDGPDFSDGEWETLNRLRALRDNPFPVPPDSTSSEASESEPPPPGGYKVTLHDDEHPEGRPARITALEGPASRYGFKDEAAEAAEPGPAPSEESADPPRSGWHDGGHEIRAVPLAGSAAEAARLLDERREALALRQALADADGERRERSDEALAFGLRLDPKHDPEDDGEEPVEARSPTLRRARRLREMADRPEHPDRDRWAAFAASAAVQLEQSDDVKPAADTQTERLLAVSRRLTLTGRAVDDLIDAVFRIGGLPRSEAVDDAIAEGSTADGITVDPPIAAIPEEPEPDLPEYDHDIDDLSASLAALGTVLTIRGLSRGERCRRASAVIDRRVRVFHITTVGVAMFDATPSAIWTDTGVSNGKDWLAFHGGTPDVDLAQILAAEVLDPPAES